MTPLLTPPSSCSRPRGTGAASNPFSSSRVEPGAVPLVGLSARHLYDELSRLGRMAQVIGPHGAGKSTLLAHLAREARARGEAVSVVRASARGFPWKRTCSLLIVDEADSMPEWMRAALRAGCRLTGRGLLLCVHADSGLPTLVRMAPELSTTRLIVAHLCKDRPVKLPDDEQLRGLLDEHGGNLRAVLFALYDWYEQGLLSAEGEP